MNDKRPAAAPTPAAEGSAAPFAPGRGALLTLALAILALVADHAQPTAATWARLTPGNCAEYCEGSQRCGAADARPFIQQPLNTWSNLAYVFVGAGVALAPTASAAGLFFGFSSLLLGVGSFLFHAAVTREFQWLDVAGMYCTLVALVGLGSARLLPRHSRVLLAATVVTAGLMSVFKWQLNTWLVIPALVLAAAAVTWAVARKDAVPLAPALGTGALTLAALGFQRLDVHRTLCWPQSGLFQGHALWHILTAWALLRSYRFLAASMKPQGSGSSTAQTRTKPSSDPDFSG